jgi:hypothetical protein
MAGRLFALLVGIDRYPAEVGPLNGCVNDVDLLHDHLRHHATDPAALAIECLKDSDATRDNLVQAFRKHLGQVRAGDVALFHYSGHGARWAAAAAFKEFYPDGKDEGLVCVDSRAPGGFDLADKELAVLLDEVAARGAHLAVSLDCCHSGSGTRSADAFRGLRARATHEVFQERPLESYLDGHYARLRQRGRPLHIPTGRHILLAACDRTQQARETPDNYGVFTATLVEVLEKSGGNLSYAEVFVRCRAAVHRRADDQLPQFESYGHFNAWSGFLGRAVTRAASRYSVAYDDGEWRVDCGAIHGMPTDPERKAELTLYPEDGNVAPAGTAGTLQVGAQRTVLQLNFAADLHARFRAELTSLPVEPLWLWVPPGEPHHASVQRALVADAAVGMALTDVAEAARYAVVLQDSRLLLTRKDDPQPIQRVEFEPAKPDAAMPALLSVLEQVAQWERGLILANPATELDSATIDFVCIEPAPEGAGAEPVSHVGPEVTLESRKRGSGDSARWDDIWAKLKARNRSGQTLHFLLAYYSPDFGVQVLRNDPVPSGDDWVTLFGDGETDYFWVDEEENESIDRFKLIVSTGRVDAFLLEQVDLERGATRGASRTLGAARRIGRKVKGEHWLTRDLRVRTVRRLNELGNADWVSANGRITVTGHPRVTASISLGAPPAAGRGAGAGLPFEPAFARAGLRLLNFGNTRDAADSMLELTNIEHADRLRQQPLELVLNVPLAADEGILPFVFDGQHVMLAGQPARDEQGRTHVTIDYLHELPSERRSLGGALKLYFFKTYLRVGHVNRLCWVDYRADGSFERQSGGVAERVAAARRVLLLVHGIIGDTEGMAAGIRACGLDRRFDLVLCYDYENLSTPIAETARQLAADLRAVGLGPQDQQHLTLLVHSMGGLVSRCFIERDGGSTMVDHLVMCGTPNQGSPFGKVDDARKFVTMLTGLAANASPALLPFTAPLLFLLNRSTHVTPTLQQMDPSSDFIRGLNASPDPGVPYTVLAGNVDAYDESSDPMFAKLLAKMGRSTLFDLLFGQRPNDIAVAVDSVLGGAAARPSVSRFPVPCHHLNYFSSRAGQAALASVAW